MTSSLPRCLEEFEGVCLQLDHHAGRVDLDYELWAEADGQYRIVRDGSTVASTPYRSNLVALLQLDLVGAVQRLGANAGVWIHAAGLQRPDGGGLLLVGPASAGKSTAALSLCRSGWRLAADDVVWLVPGRGFRGLGWAISLKQPAVKVELLRQEGFACQRQLWCIDDAHRAGRWRIRPPPNLIANSDHWLGLDGIGFLERGPSGVRALTAGEMIIRLWPQRIARSDDAESWMAARLANELARTPAAVIQSNAPQETVGLVLEWAAELKRQA